MCNTACLDFIRSNLSRDDVFGRKVLEVGSCDVNGSVRKLISSLEPASYLGVDIAAGPGVDEICNVSSLVSRFGESAFDVIVSTEVIEHVLDWREAVRNMKLALRRGGIILVTTRSEGFRSHGFPCDFWRYGAEDMKIIFGRFEILSLENDPIAPGIFMKARKTESSGLSDTPAGFSLYSVIRRSRCDDITPEEIRQFEKYLAMKTRLARFMPVGLKDFLKKILDLR